MKITIDPGHYSGYNKSPCDGAYNEGDAMWTLSAYLRDELISLGAEAVLTRESSKQDVTLSTRGKLAKGGDFFISMHSNAAGSGVFAGTDYPLACVYQDVGWTEIDDVSGDVGEELALLVEKLMGTKQHGRISRRKASGDRDGNGALDDEYYGVLYGARLAGVPGVILEHSFHTDPTATAWLLKDANLRKLAKAEAGLIFAYFGGKNEKTPLFSDISGHWAREYIEKAAEAGILTGFEDGTFRPDESLTRAQAAAIVARMI